MPVTIVDRFGRSVRQQTHRITQRQGNADTAKPTGRVKPVSVGESSL
jgi:hypothetical protein